MRLLLLEIKAVVEQAKSSGGTHLSSAVIRDFEGRYQALLCAGYARNPFCEKAVVGKRGRGKQSKSYNLLKRLDADRLWVLGFLYDFDVPFDNNQAERDIRMLKVQQKVSGCFRSFEGARAFCTVRSYLSTLRKQEQSLLSALEHVFLGKPILPKMAA